MNFEDEHYVRIYTRDTKTWLRWGWEGQAVFTLTARKLDALGRLSVDDPVADVALLTGMPEDLVRVGLQRVLDSGAFVVREGYLECPNWIDGQTATKSDSVRCREYRERLKARRVIPRGERGRDTGRVESDTKRVTANTGRVESDTSRPSSTRDDTRSGIPSQPNAAQPISLSPLPPSSRERPGESEIGIVPQRHNRIPPSWVPNERTKVDAQERGFSVDEFKEFLKWLRNQYWERAFLDPDKQAQLMLGKWTVHRQVRDGKTFERERGERGARGSVR